MKPAFKIRLSFSCDADVQSSPGTTDVLCLVFGVRTVEGRADSVEGLLVDPHEGPRLVGLAFVIDAAEFVAELAVLPLVVIVVFCLPDRLKRPGLVELDTNRIVITNTAAKRPQQTPDT